jgi:hypothetical protein
MRAKYWWILPRAHRNRWYEMAIATLSVSRILPLERRAIMLTQTQRARIRKLDGAGARAYLKRLKVCTAWTGGPPFGIPQDRLHY